MRRLPRLAVVLAGLLAPACDQSFAPIEPSEQQFSIFGYLDAAADTQWVRVMPMRPLVLTTAEPLGARVTLERVGGAGVVELRDSVFRFAAGSGVGSEGVFVHNYWTTQRLEPGAAYRFRVEQEGKRPVETVVQLPRDYDVEVWLGQARYNESDYVRVAGVRYVGLLGVLTHLVDECGEAVDRSVTAAPPADGDVQLIRIVQRPSSRSGCTNTQVEKRELLVVGSGAEWPSGLDLPTTRLGSPDHPSGITNATGFLGGVLTKRVPYEACEIEIGSAERHCRLRYDGTTASLRAVVRDTACGNAPVAGATVRLRELDPVPPARSKVRTATSNRAGEFEVAALVPGMRYSLSVRRVVLNPVRDLYEEHVDTLRFAVGERRRGEIGLRGLFACGGGS